MLLILAMLTGICGCGAEISSEESAESDEVSHKQFFSMDTIMTVTVYGPGGDDAVDAAVEEVNRLDQLLDPQNSSSPVYAINAAEGNATEVPEEILSLLEVSRKVYDETDGALDLSTYPLSELWGFIDLDEQDSSPDTIPSEEEILEAKDLLCFDRLLIENGTVTIPAGGKISFGSVAKGFASDAVSAVLKEQGVSSAILSLGGNIQTIGDTKPDGTSWNVSIQDPNDLSAYIGYVTTGEGAVVTSGSYQRYYEVDGKIYHHIIDPHTGYPADNDLLSVTILTPSGTLADSLSTAMFVLGEEGAVEFWRSQAEDFQMILITKDNRILCTEGLQDIYTPLSSDYSVEYISK